MNETERQPKRGRGILIERIFARGVAGTTIWKWRRALFVACLGLPAFAFAVFVAFLARAVTGSTGRVASFAIRFMRFACSCSRRKRTSSARESSFFSLIHDSEKYATCGRGPLCVPLLVRSSGQLILHKTIRWLPKAWGTC